MTRTILLTGATDGIGRLTAHTLAAGGHTLLLHGRSADKLARVAAEVTAVAGAGPVETFQADLSVPADVAAFGAAIAARDGVLDVIIHNAGVFTTPRVRTAEGLDIRFVVNTLAPYVLTRRWLSLLQPDARIVCLSSAAQAPVHIAALKGRGQLADFDAYAQSKLALTAWCRHLAAELGPDGPVVVAVNPGSMLASKMVRDAFGRAGRSLAVGADILVRAALDPAFADATGQYFDNDAGRFGPPHPAAMDDRQTARLVETLAALAEDWLPA